jgi:hypothetical protein
MRNQFSDEVNELELKFKGKRPMGDPTEVVSRY